jgi:hypothetical protein
MENAATGKQFFCAQEGELVGLQEERFRESQPIRSWDRHSWVAPLDTRTDGDPDDYLANTHSLVILSKRVELAMRGHGIAVQDVQFLPIHVRRSTGEALGEFAVLNVLSRVEAVDRQRSFLLTDADDVDPVTQKRRIRNIGRPAVFASALRGHDIVRLLDFPYPLLCSERFAQMWTQNQFTGAVLSPLSVAEEEPPTELLAVQWEAAAID